MTDDNYQLKLVEEYNRLVDESLSSNNSSNLGTVSYLIECKKNSKKVIENIKHIILIIDRHIIDNNMSFERKKWEIVLPSWFVHKFAKERTKQQKKEYLIWWDGLSNKEKEQQAKLPQTWSLLNWISYFDPEQRQWYWWNYRILDTTHFIISLEVRGSPFPSGAFYWLLQASGAIKIEEIEEE